MAILLLKEEIVIYQLPDYKPMSTGLIVEVKEYKIQSTELEEVIATIVEMNEKEKDKPVEVYYTPKCKEIYFVKMIEEYGWFESLYEVNTHGKESIIRPIEDVGHAILDVEYISIKGFDHMILKVVDRNHMGNGSIHLYELTDTGMRPLLTTRFIDINKEAGDYYGLYEDKELDFAVLDEKEGVAQIEISGQENIFRAFPSGKDYLYESYHFRSIFVYDEQEGKYKCSGTENELIYKSKENETTN